MPAATNVWMDVTVETNTGPPSQYKMVMLLATVCEYCCHSSAAFMRRTTEKHS